MDLERLLKYRLCNHCLGRQAAQLLSGYTNEERGKVIRNYAAMRMDSGEKLNVNINNFHGIRFHNEKVNPQAEECFVCKGLLDNLSLYIAKATPKLRKIEVET